MLKYNKRNLKKGVKSLKKIKLYQPSFSKNEIKDLNLPNLNNSNPNAGQNFDRFRENTLQTSLNSPYGDVYNKNINSGNTQQKVSNLPGMSDQNKYLNPNRNYNSLRTSSTTKEIPIIIKKPLPQKFDSPYVNLGSSKSINEKRANIATEFNNLKSNINDMINRFEYTLEQDISMMEDLGTDEFLDKMTNNNQKPNINKPADQLTDVQYLRQFSQTISSSLDDYKQNKFRNINNASLQNRDTKEENIKKLLDDIRTLEIELDD